MKRLFLTLLAIVTLAISASAMSYEQARDRALFLTDKMAYELNLTEEQYEAAYEINLDYLMGVTSVDDVYGIYWQQRNLDLSYILLDWQYRQFCDATYFYRPLWWDGGYWHFGIYARYPHRDYFYFGRPYFVTVYHGGHSWRYNGGRSWYRGRRFDGPGYRHGGRGYGMRDGYRRGDYRGRTVQANNRTFGNGSFSRRPSVVRQDNRTYNSRGFGGTRRSSTRSTVTRPSAGNHTFGGGARYSAPSRSFTPSTRSGSSFGGNRGGFGSSSRSNSTFNARPNTSFGGGSRSGGFSGSRSGGFSSSRSGGFSSSRSGGFSGGGHSFGGGRR